MSSHHYSMRALAELEVLIVDCQTTGATPALGHVLELGWALARADRPSLVAAEAHWIALPEGHVVPRQVRKITGYEPQHALGAISDREAWQRLRAALHSAPAAPSAIHYARFELAFLRDWATRLEPETPFPFDAVCIHAIACRIFPDLPRTSLRALAGYLGHGLDLTRRALGHVEATAFVWRKLCAELEGRGIVSWEHLQPWLEERGVKKKRAVKPRYSVATVLYKQLPDSPGVYRFLRSNGDVLYVGKAASLKKRVASHFLSRASKQQAPEMLTQVADIRVTHTASALEAALLEHATISELQPPYNVQLTSSDPRVWYSDSSFVSAKEVPDESHTIGPLASEFSLRPLAALIALVSRAAITPALRSQAVGVSDLWTPDEQVFAAGFAGLVAKHSALSAGLPSARQAVLNLAQQLLLEGAPAKGEDETLESAADATPHGWTPERVLRHIERAAAQAYQAYRRARWLLLLHDRDILFREPTSSQTRYLRLRNGELAEAGDVSAELLRAPQHARNARSPCWQAHFDRTKYDRLRVLTTELKRVYRAGGSVSVRARFGVCGSAAVL
jgi:DNA polymerase III epsilon subunit-like protein